MQASKRVPLGFETAAAVRPMVGFAALTATLRVYLAHSSPLTMPSDHVTPYSA
jgi:hypothetical protein